MLLIQGGTIHNGVDPTPFRADILIENGKILRIGENLSAPGAQIFCAEGLYLWPGFIDAHTHIGMFGYSIDSKDDVELYDRCTPHHRGIDAVNPMEPTFRAALCAGVTCVCVGPGSVSCIAGTHAAVKTHGQRIDEMIVKDPVAMKVAFGSNPKSHSKDGVSTRMTIAAVLREYLHRAKLYAAKLEQAAGNLEKLPPYDPKLEALLPVIRKEIPLKAHAHRADDLFTAIRIAKEYDVLLTLEHANDGALVADKLAREGYPIAVGPYLNQAKKEENANKSPAAAAEMIRAGCHISVMTDSPVIAQQYLPMTAGLLMGEGISEFEALQTITINPARHLGIEDRVGSLEEGKDADIVIARGCPLHVHIRPCAVLVNGEVVYSAE